MASVYTHMDYIYIETAHTYTSLQSNKAMENSPSTWLHGTISPYISQLKSRPFPLFLVYQNKSLQGPGSQHFNAAQLLRCGPQPHHAGPAVPQLDDRGFFGQNGFDFCGTWGVLFLPSALGPTMSQESALKLGHQLDGLVVELPIL